MFEPRGHDIMSGAIIYPAHREDYDFAALFVAVSGCLPLCGAGTIGLSTVVIEEGLVSPRTSGRLSIEVPPGRVDVDYTPEGGRVTSVRRFNVSGRAVRRPVREDRARPAPWRFRQRPAPARIRTSAAPASDAQAVRVPRTAASAPCRPVTNLSHKASLLSQERIAPANQGIKHLAGASDRKVSCGPNNATSLWIDAANDSSRSILPSLYSFRKHSEENIALLLTIFSALCCAYRGNFRRKEQPCSTPVPTRQFTNFSRVR